MTSAEALVQQLRLRALAHSGRSEQHQPQAKGCGPQSVEHFVDGPCSQAARSFLFCEFIGAFALNRPQFETRETSQTTAK
jgi:hypothetical protein